MRTYTYLLGLVLVGCDSGPEVVAVAGPVVPTPGTYDGTLVDYLARGCDPSFGQPVGVLDAVVQVEYVSQGHISVLSNLAWPYGAVALVPGDPNDKVEYLAWRGTASTPVVRSGCPLSASVLVRYFPADLTHGALHVFTHYESQKTCKYVLPCDDKTIWRLQRQEVK